jgi:ornithine carbamoyltransferase
LINEARVFTGTIGPALTGVDEVCTDEWWRLPPAHEKTRRKIKMMASFILNLSMFFILPDNIF